MTDIFLNLSLLQKCFQVLILTIIENIISTNHQIECSFLFLSCVPGSMCEVTKTHQVNPRFTHKEIKLNLSSLSYNKDVYTLIDCMYIYIKHKAYLITNAW